MTTNTHLSTTEPKKTKQKKKHLSTQLEQEHNHSNGNHMEGYQWGGGEGGRRKKVQGISSINDRQKIGTGYEQYRKQRSQRIYMNDPCT